MAEENEYRRRDEAREEPQETSIIEDTTEKKSSKKNRKKSSKEVKSASNSNGSSADGFLAKFKNRYEMKRFRAIFGGIMLIFSIFLFLSLTSYLFTWKVDQSQVINRGFWSYIFDGDIENVENWLGRFGAWFSHLLIYRWVGVSAFVIPFLLTLYSIYHLFGYTSARFPLKRTTTISLFFMFWTALFLGFFAPHINYLGGTFGYFTNNWLDLTIGKIGNFFFQFLVLYIASVVFFNFNLKEWVQKFRKFRLPLDDEENPTSYDDENPSPQNPVENDIQIINTIKDHQIKKDDIRETVDFGDGKENLYDENDFEPIEETPAKDDALDLDIEKAVVSTSSAKENDSTDLEIEVAKSPEAMVPADKAELLRREYGEYDPTLELNGYVLPPTDLLKDFGGNTVNIDKAELEENKNKIVETLSNYKIDISKIKATVGPTVTLYEIIPAPGVRISKIKNLEDDIALSLAALGIRIIAPIPGKGTIGIEVPNRKREVVSMRSLITSEKFQNSDYELPVVIGRTITNETYTFDLTKMPHLLVAGATGQGKSVGLNAIIVSMLYKKHPSQVKFVLVDPKKVELTLYNKLEKHFLAKLPDSEEAIITDTSKVVDTLNSLCIEMDDRYELLKKAQVRTIKEYNKKFIGRGLNPENGHRYLPYIVVLIDEFADLIMTAGREIEQPIARIAQLARAIGIHLIVATQRPSVNVITGMIKANFPARIAFRVQSKIDSRTILDSNGADQLIGMGDMLISTGSDLIRLQCGFVDTPEVEAICEYIGQQKSYPSAFELPEYVAGEGGDSSANIDVNEIDPLFADAARIVVETQQGSASMLQRKLKLGYNRAGRIIDQLEAYGVVGPHQGSKARDVNFQDYEALDEFLRSKNLDN